MAGKKRTNEILAILTQRGRVEVAALSAELGVSQVTIRKDLDQLSAGGLVTREHGFAVLNSADDISGRLAYHYEEKKKIARRAADMVADGDTVMIESGSCCALLAAALAESRRNLTIVTNSAFIAGYIRGKADFQIVLLGGIYQHDSQCLVGPMVRAGAENYNVGLLFVGTDGYSPRTGFTNKDQLRAQAVRDMAERCDRVVVVTESEKFASHGTVPLHLPGRKMVVITDGRIPAEAAAALRAEGAELIVAE